MHFKTTLKHLSITTSKTKCQIAPLKRYFKIAITKTCLLTQQYLQNDIDKSLILRINYALLGFFNKTQS